MSTTTAAPQTGRAWVLGDDLNTDLLAPGRYMKFGVEEIARHCLESLVPSFAADVRPGDIVVAGRNFGVGSSREQAVEVLRHLGVACVVAASYAGLYYRNGFNLGLPLLVCTDVDRMAGITDGSRLALDLDAARLHDPATGLTLQCEPVPAHLIAMVRDGGLVPHLQRRLSREDIPAQNRLRKASAS
ncbi:MAG: 3-isopropylmalate dehydratase [Variovorax sp.]|nr:MAG: 3-isopropylmalate dehydratase [Variovorax sp.]